MDANVKVDMVYGHTKAGDLQLGLESLSISRPKDNSGEDSTLRQRKKTEKVEQLPGKEKEEEKCRRELEKNAFVQKWLGVKPRGRLESSQKAFVRALDIAIELAQHTIQTVEKLEKCKAQGNQVEE
mmetsp:Transcript_1190/g.1414  ORF Transcript_1190/g.1414 Transcript_1190/m.1414 type:complete len:126 (-) Transcript_1190:137-514(-)